MQITTQDANKNPLEGYLHIVRHFYFLHEVEAYENLKWTCPSYQEACKEKNDRLKDWESFIAHLRRDSKLRIRDAQHEPWHGYKAIISFGQGIGLCAYLSFMGNLIGFYYMQDDTPKSKRQIIDDYESYDPCFERQTTFRELILRDLIQWFPEFTEFNNEYADYKIDQVHTYAGFKKNIDLFQVLFSDNIHGLI
jgi:hypothetical protein